MKTPTGILVEKLKALNTKTIKLQDLYQLCQDERWAGFLVDSRGPNPYSPTLEDALFNLGLAGLIKYDWEYGEGTLIIMDLERLRRCNLQ